LNNSFSSAIDGATWLASMKIRTKK
jgi:hypothetical protein